MDDYIRESFVELMQRGIEVDVVLFNHKTIRVLWLNKNRDALCIGNVKGSAVKQEFELKKLSVGDCNDNKLIHFVTSERPQKEIKFHVDTEKSRDILVTNLSKLVNNHKKMALSCSTAPEYGGEWGYLLVAVIVLACIVIGTSHFTTAEIFRMAVLDAEIMLGIGAFAVLAIVLFIANASRLKSPPAAQQTSEHVSQMDYSAEETVNVTVNKSASTPDYGLDVRASAP